jgi:hypothetical protein
VHNVNSFNENGAHNVASSASASLAHAATALPVLCRTKMFVIISALVLSSIEGAGTAIGLAVDGSHTCVIRASDRSLVCFGSNAAYQLGYGTSMSR